MEFIKIKTRIVNPPRDEIWDILDTLALQDGDIVFITSKVLAIHQGRCIKAKDSDKHKLIEQNSTYHLPYIHPKGFEFCLTITDNILIPNAGIDESNSNGHYILWPKKADELCAEIRVFLCKKFGTKNVAVIATDSYTTPLRYGVTGITIGFSGIEPLNDVRGQPDIFGREMRVTQVNIIDPLSSMAVLLMGEGSEQTPIVILRGYKQAKFNSDATMEDFKIPPEIDIYKPLLDVFVNK